MIGFTSNSGFDVDTMTTEYVVPIGISLITQRVTLRSRFHVLRISTTTWLQPLSVHS